MYCSGCGSQNGEASKFCARCGGALGAPSQTRVEAAPPQNLQFAMPGAGGAAATQAIVAADKKYAAGKTPWVAAVLSFLIVGVGQFYNGDHKKGVVMLLLAIVLAALTAGVGNLLISIWSAIDAYQVAKGHSPLW